MPFLWAKMANTGETAHNCFPTIWKCSGSLCVCVYVFALPDFMPKNTFHFMAAHTMHCLLGKPAGKANFWKTYAIKSVILNGLLLYGYFSFPFCKWFSFGFNFRLFCSIFFALRSSFWPSFCRFKIHAHRQHIFQFIKSCDSCHKSQMQIKLKFRIKMKRHCEFTKRPLKLPIRLWSVCEEEEEETIWRFDEQKQTKKRNEI